MSQAWEELPWTTAPEYVEELLEELGVPDDSKTAELAREWGQSYGIEQPIEATPKSVAAGAVYFAGMFDPGLTFDPPGRPRQQDIADVADVGTAAIGRAYRQIAEAEGYELGRREPDTGPDPGLLAKLRRRLST